MPGILAAIAGACAAAVAGTHNYGNRLVKVLLCVNYNNKTINLSNPFSKRSISTTIAVCRREDATIFNIGKLLYCTQLKEIIKIILSCC